MIHGGVDTFGFFELRRLLIAAEPEARKAIDASAAVIAEKIRADAERLAETQIRRIGPRWSQMRVGVTSKLVYVAPKQRGVKVRGPSPRRRPKFADLMAERAMQPALERNEHLIQAEVDAAFARLIQRLNARS